MIEFQSVTSQSLNPMTEKIENYTVRRAWFGEWCIGILGLAFLPWWNPLKYFYWNHGNYTGSWFVRVLWFVAGRFPGGRIRLYELKAISDSGE